MADRAEFQKDDLGLGCSQATLGDGFAPAFAIQDGVLAAGAVFGEITVTDTGIALGDPVSEVLRAYPGIGSAPDPSGFDGATVDYMQFGLAGSVGEAPCV